MPADAELEDGGFVIGGAPLDAEADDEAATAEVVVVECTDPVEPPADDGGLGGDGGEDFVLMAFYGERSVDVGVWGVVRFYAYSTHSGI